MIYRIVIIHVTGERIPMSKVSHKSRSEAERWLNAVQYAGIIDGATYEIVEEAIENN